ncbi:hypothetical protein E2P81_ATG07129 [Venturia nashicola]|nr:hypothetical protein E2P81_ATG07129 [Venturia nashicola]
MEEKIKEIFKVFLNLSSKYMAPLQHAYGSSPARIWLLSSKHMAPLQQAYGSSPARIWLLSSRHMAPLEQAYGSSPASTWLLSSTHLAPLQQAYGPSQANARAHYHVEHVDRVSTDGNWLRKREIRNSSKADSSHSKFSCWRVDLQF